MGSPSLEFSVLNEEV